MLIQKKRTSGFTLVELLVVIGIILLLAAAAVTVSGYVTKKAKIRTTKATMGMLVAALQAYKEYEDRSSGFSFPPSPYTEEEIATGNLPVEGGTGTYYDDALGGTLYREGHHDLTNYPEEWDGLDIANLWAAQASVEVLYFYLDDVPASRKVLNKLSGSVTANEDGDYVVPGSGDEKGLIEVIDGWKLPLRYETRGSGNFPLISSAGPDGVFDTADDILSSEL